MADIVNLRQARKQKARATKEKTAEENRIAHGMPKSLREATRAETSRQAARLEAHRRERPEGDSEA